MLRICRTCQKYRDIFKLQDTQFYAYTISSCSWWKSFWNTTLKMRWSGEEIWRIPVYGICLFVSWFCLIKSCAFLEEFLMQFFFLTVAWEQCQAWKICTEIPLQAGQDFIRLSWKPLLMLHEYSQKHNHL